MVKNTTFSMKLSLIATTIIFYIFCNFNCAFTNASGLDISLQTESPNQLLTNTYEQPFHKRIFIDDFFKILQDNDDEDEKIAGRSSARNTNVQKVVEAYHRLRKPLDLKLESKRLDKDEKDETYFQRLLRNHTPNHSQSFVSQKDHIRRALKTWGSFSRMIKYLGLNDLTNAPYAYVRRELLDNEDQPNSVTGHAGQGAHHILRDVRANALMRNVLARSIRSEDNTESISRLAKYFSRHPTAAGKRLSRLGRSNDKRGVDPSGPAKSAESGFTRLIRFEDKGGDLSRLATSAGTGFIRLMRSEGKGGYISRLARSGAPDYTRLMRSEHKDPTSEQKPEINDIPIEMRAGRDLTRMMRSGDNSNYLDRLARSAKPNFYRMMRDEEKGGYFSRLARSEEPDYTRLMRAEHKDPTSEQKQEINDIPIEMRAGRDLTRVMRSGDNSNYLDRLARSAKPNFYRMMRGEEKGGYLSRLARSEEPDYTRLMRSQHKDPISEQKPEINDIPIEMRAGRDLTRVMRSGDNYHYLGRLARSAKPNFYRMMRAEEKGGYFTRLARSAGTEVSKDSYTRTMKSENNAGRLSRLAMLDGEAFIRGMRSNGYGGDNHLTRLVRSKKADVSRVMMAEDNAGDRDRLVKLPMSNLIRIRVMRSEDDGGYPRTCHYTGRYMLCGNLIW